MTAEVELLREAARLMRERANAATPSPWTATSNRSIEAPAGCRGRVVASVGAYECGWPSTADAQHIASWDPMSALAVADLLDTFAEYDWSDERHRAALTLARRYLRLCTCTIDPDGARNTDGCVLHDLPPCGFLVDEVSR
ncbi:hypothetical protein AB0I89_23475 [Micromonospora sp. NPDC049801]|uniref:hypothetical protein n=1 Tax=unclassified Micromonospora TaxID=2617518 RepID=UPI0033C4BDE2